MAATRSCLLALLLPSSMAAMSTAAMTRKLVEVSPGKATLLMKAWQSRAAEQNVLKTVPDGKTGKKLKVVRVDTGEEAEQRAMRKQQLEAFQRAAQALASADAGEYPEARRQLIPELQLAGAKRGPNAKVFAAVGDGASTCSDPVSTERPLARACSPCRARRDREPPPPTQLDRHPCSASQVGSR